MLLLLQFASSLAECSNRKGGVASAAGRCAGCCAGYRVLNGNGYGRRADELTRAQDIRPR